MNSGNQLANGTDPDVSPSGAGAAQPAAPPGPGSGGWSLAQRKRRLVRDELAEAALRLLAANGYEQTTIEQIVAGAGVSRRTFFRYFKSKEDVVVASLEDLEEAVRAELGRRPEGEDARAALRAALQVAVDDFTETPAKSVPIIRVTLQTPALRARYLEWRAVLQDVVAALLNGEAGEPAEADLRSTTVAGCALAAFDAALARWVSEDGAADLNALVDEAFAYAFPSGD